MLYSGRSNSTERYSIYGLDRQKPNSFFAELPHWHPPAPEDAPRDRRFLVCERDRRSRQRGNPTAPHRWVGILRFAVYHLCLRLESAGQVV